MEGSRTFNLTGVIANLNDSVTKETFLLRMTQDKLIQRATYMKYLFENHSEGDLLVDIHTVGREIGGDGSG